MDEIIVVYSRDLRVCFGCYSVRNTGFADNFFAANSGASDVSDFCRYYQSFGTNWCFFGCIVSHKTIDFFDNHQNWTTDCFDANPGIGFVVFDRHCGSFATNPMFGKSSDDPMAPNDSRCTVTDESREACSSCCTVATTDLWPDVDDCMGSGNDRSCLLCFCCNHYDCHKRAVLWRTSAETFSSRLR